jgi:hypothetical protein
MPNAYSLQLAMEASGIWLDGLSEPELSEARQLLIDLTSDGEDQVCGGRRLIRDISDGERLSPAPASPMSNAFSSYHLQRQHGSIAWCSTGSVRELAV